MNSEWYCKIQLCDEYAPFLPVSFARNLVAVENVIALGYLMGSLI